MISPGRTGVSSSNGRAPQAAGNTSRRRRRPRHHRHDVSVHSPRTRPRLRRLALVRRTVLRSTATARRCSHRTCHIIRSIKI